VGLVRYGAHKLAEARARAEAVERDELMAPRGSVNEPEQRRNGFWTWFKAAF
jgi:hypothetical protein